MASQLQCLEKHPLSMKMQTNSNIYNIILPMLIVLSVIVIAKAGYTFGVWLFAVIH